VVRIFRLDAHDRPSRGRRDNDSGNPPDRRRPLGDKLQLLALRHPASLKVLEEMVDDLITRLNEE
jgi:hypothetical protein